MSTRELVVLGTASQVPTRRRNHNVYLCFAGTARAFSSTRAKAPSGRCGCHRRHPDMLRRPIEAYGYRLIEPDGHQMLPDRLRAYGITGPAVGKLSHAGHLDVGGRRVTLDEVSAARRGQRFAFVMDTALCDNVYALAEGADLLVIESTFLAEDAALAEDYGRLTAAQAARVAAESGVRRLVLTHFSQRYPAPERFAAEAREQFSGDLVIAEDLTRLPIPPRRVPSAE